MPTMPRSFLIKKSSTKVINSSFSSNTNTSCQPNGCTDDEENVSLHNDHNNKSFVDVSYGKFNYHIIIDIYLVNTTVWYSIVFVYCIKNNTQNAMSSIEGSIMK